MTLLRIPLEFENCLCFFMWPPLIVLRLSLMQIHISIENYFIFFCLQGNIEKGSKKARGAWSLECSQQNDSNILPFLTIAANEIESIPYK